MPRGSAVVEEGIQWSSGPFDFFKIRAGQAYPAPKPTAQEGKLSDSFSLAAAPAKG